MKHIFLIFFLIGVFRVMSQASLDMDSLRLNDIRIIASHNSYKKLPHPKVLKFLSRFQDQLGDENNPAYIDYGHLPFGEQFSDYGVRGVELDVNYNLILQYIFLVQN